MRPKSQRHRLFVCLSSTHSFILLIHILLSITHVDVLVSDHLTVGINPNELTVFGLSDIHQQTTKDII
jgi:hypothetical protein